MVNPAVLASVTVPCETLSFSESEPFPGPLSATVTALLVAGSKTSSPFSLTTAPLGAVIVGGRNAVIVRATPVEADSLSPESEIPIEIESAPE